MDEAATLQFFWMQPARLCGRRSVVKVQERSLATIVLEQGKWRFHDNYSAGVMRKEVVFLEGRPVWMAAITDGSKARAPTPKRVTCSSEGPAGGAGGIRYAGPMSSRRGDPPTGTPTKAAWPTSRAKRLFTRGPAGLHRPLRRGLVDRRLGGLSNGDPS